jgi:RNA 2',3'-cyclic 3'-phosphodiesterase
MKRIFAAVNINPGNQLIHLLDQLKSALAKDKIKWVDPGNMHITLKFFGETPDEKVAEIENVLHSINHKNAFGIEIKELGIFGSSYKPKVIWLGLADCPEFHLLENEITKAIQPIGYLPDRQNFVPHITLGRINFLNDKKYFQQMIDKYKSFSPDQQQISVFHLYESILKQTCPEYRIIGSFNFLQ